MTLEEYIEASKAELDEMAAHYKAQNKKYPEDWPLEMADDRWIEQELEYRF